MPLWKWNLKNWYHKLMTTIHLSSLCFQVPNTSIAAHAEEGWGTTYVFAPSSGMPQCASNIVCCVTRCFGIYSGPICKVRLFYHSHMTNYHVDCMGLERMNDQWQSAVDSCLHDVHVLTDSSVRLQSAAGIWRQWRRYIFKWIVRGEKYGANLLAVTQS